VRRGDVYWVELDPVRGSEANKTRPAVIVSNDAANRAAKRAGHGVVTVVPITSNVGRVYPFQVLLSAKDCGLPTDSKAQAEQVRTISTDRVRKQIGVVPAAEMGRLDGALRTHLAL
jgi:mRNA interferase MazF